MSMRKAINDKCKDCIYDPLAGGTWREQVAQCSCVTCPLWTLRPEPSSGPFHGAPRNPEAVSREWIKASHGMAESSMAGMK